LPEGTWYVFENKTRIESGGEFFELDAPLEKIPILVRGGKIVPKQQSASTTTKRFKKAFNNWASFGLCLG
jgi:alpha-glucosidase (family GH31 glycosyl hydrolase)